MSSSSGNLPGLPGQPQAEAYHFVLTPVPSSVIWQSTATPLLWGGIDPGLSWQPIISPLYFHWGIPAEGVSYTIPAELAQFQVHLLENEQEIMATAELPGINPFNLALTVTLRSLTISLNIRLPEATGVILYRTFPLTSSVRGDLSTASYRNGLLEVHMPKHKPVPWSTHSGTGQ